MLRAKLAAAWVASILVAAVTPTAVEAQAVLLAFSSPHAANRDISGFTKWNAALRGIARTSVPRVEICAGDCFAPDWRRDVLRLRGQDAQRQLDGVNQLVNRVRYVEDQVNYGVEDYWASPDEFFARGGDCEDYVIAKYAALRLLGWPAERLRMAVVYDQQRSLMHAVLLVQVDGATYTLDNRENRALPPEALPHYRLIYAINEQAWWPNS
jgi:predicted transglutaminase-like cysteine proteinase